MRFKTLAASYLNSIESGNKILIYKSFFSMVFKGQLYDFVKISHADKVTGIPHPGSGLRLTVSYQVLIVATFG